MEKLSTYKRAHLVVAAIRLLQHQTDKPPGVAQLSECLDASTEQLFIICRKLAEAGIIDMVEGAYGEKLFVKDHLKIEGLPDTAEDNGLQKDLKKFQQEQQKRNEKIEAMKSQEEARKKALFDQLNSQLKQKTSTTPNPE